MLTLHLVIEENEHVNMYEQTNTIEQIETSTKRVFANKVYFLTLFSYQYLHSDISQLNG